MTEGADQPKGLQKVLRGIFTLGYYLLCAGFVFTVAFSVSYGAYRSYDDESATAPATISPSDADGEKCVRDVDAKLTGLHTQAWDTFAGVGTKGALRGWAKWSKSWRQSMDGIRTRCHLKSSLSMRPVALYVKDVERIHLAYDTGLRAFSNLAKRPARRIRERRDER